METYGIWIDGEELTSVEREAFDSLEPGSGKPWARIVAGTAADVDAAVAAAQRAGQRGAPWADLTPANRRQLILELAAIVRENSEMLAVIESRDAGKLLRETRLHVEACAEWLEYFAGATDKLHGATIPVEPGVLNYTVRQPLGVVGAIVPGNSPLLLTIWKVAPALATGNTLVIKPSEYTTASLIALMRCWKQKIPPGVINVVPGFGIEVGAAIAGHPGVRKIAFTGGTQAGASVAATAAARVVPSILELGGKSANIVFADADFERAVAGIMAGVFAASGQTCMAGSRVLIERPIYDKVVAELVRRAGSITVGEPAEPSTQVGPLGSAKQLDRVDALVTAAITAGATVHHGGHREVVPGREGGWYYSPTILSDVARDAEIYREEIFGPVMVLAPFDSEEEALEIANDSNFGLVAGLWTTNLSRAHRMSERLDVGTVFVNLYRKVLPQTPFGGRNNSGYGRENGTEVLLEYTQVKSVLIDLDDSRVQDAFVMRVGSEG